MRVHDARGCDVNVYIAVSAAFVPGWDLKVSYLRCREPFPQPWAHNGTTVPFCLTRVVGGAEHLEEASYVDTLQTRTADI